MPEVTAAELTPELVRAGILRDGCLLIRGLIDRDQALRLAGEIEQATEARRALGSGAGASEGYYEEFDPGPEVDLATSSASGSPTAGSGRPTRRS